MRRRAGTLDAVPSKRLFLSIIADYDTNRAICELVDNVLDIWKSSGESKDLKVEIEANLDQQTVRIVDRAGGVAKSNLKLLIGPGQTAIDPKAPGIGFFGVGSKRAVVALAQDISITTRHSDDEHTYRIEFDDSWLDEEEGNWDLDFYEVDSIPPGTTVIELQKLRVKLTEDVIASLKAHLGATYAIFLADKNILLLVNGDPVAPVEFGIWAFPPTFEPRLYTGDIQTAEGDVVHVTAEVGLTRESHPAGEYGLYLYCNSRLVAEALHDSTVGYMTGQVGQPHPDISLVRAIVYLEGPARAMPWNSSKSGLNANHPVFLSLRDWLTATLRDWSSLSRRLSGDWPQTVFQYVSGSIVRVEVVDFPTTRKSYLPPLPVSRPRYPDRIREANRELAKEKPWTRGLYESIAAVDLILRQRFEEKNRICLILLDSTLEIAFKEYLVNESGQGYSQKRLVELFADRKAVQSEVRKFRKLKRSTWRKIDHYYNLRCNLVHQKVTANLSDEQVSDYREIVQSILGKLFGIKFRV